MRVWRVGAGHVMLNREDKRSIFKCLGECRQLLSKVIEKEAKVRAPSMKASRL